MVKVALGLLLQHPLGRLPSVATQDGSSVHLAIEAAAAEAWKNLSFQSLGDLGENSHGCLYPLVI